MVKMMILVLTMLAIVVTVANRNGDDKGNKV